MLQSEGTFTMEGRHSSIDSNRASSGDISPYDNNSPVLSERSLMAMQDDKSLSPEKLFKVPEQCTSASNFQQKSRENSLGLWLEKETSEDYFDIWGTWHSTLKSGSKDIGMSGSHGDLCESSLLRSGPCSLSQGNLPLPSPQWLGSRREVDNGKQLIRRSQTTAALPECWSHPPLSRVCSTPQMEVGRRNSSQTDSEQPLPVRNTEPLVEHDSDPAGLHSAGKSLRQAEMLRKDRPPPPYPDKAKPSSISSFQPMVSSAEHPLWRLRRPESRPGVVGARIMTQVPEQSALGEEQQEESEQKGSLTDSRQNNKHLSEPDWYDWQRDRWQIWEILSPDNPDSLPETLV